MRKQGPADRDTKKKIKQKPNNDEEYELSRFKPLLRSVIEVLDAVLTYRFYVLTT